MRVSPFFCYLIRVISPTTFGVVVRIQSGEVFVLDMHGNIQRKSPAELSVRRGRGEATDSKDQAFKTGDLVRVVEGTYKVC